MKIFSTAPEGNDIAEYVGVDYLKFSISLIEDINDWFERVGSKIPAKYRDGIKANGDELFKELEQYGH